VQQSFMVRVLQMNGLAILCFPAASFQYIVGDGESRFYLKAVPFPLPGLSARRFLH
jgi:hypothetical protein